MTTTTNVDNSAAIAQVDAELEVIGKKKALLLAESKIYAQRFENLKIQEKGPNAEILKQQIKEQKTALEAQILSNADTSEKLSDEYKALVEK